jgi:hypothetical protein
MTRHETLSCVHEPFGEAWYFGPERLNPRIDDENGPATLENGHQQHTYGDVVKEMDQQAEETVSFRGERAEFSSHFWWREK